MTSRLTDPNVKFMTDQQRLEPMGPPMVEVDDQICLQYSRCEKCSAAVFPPQPSCARCGTDHVRIHTTPAQGDLWSWTIQRFRPSAPPYDGPDHFEPFGVAIVRFADDLRVMGRFAGWDRTEVRMGMPVRTRRYAHHLGCGNELTTYEFVPATEVER